MHRETEIEFSIFADNICCSYIFAYIKFTLLNILRKDMIWRTIHTSQLRQCISPFRFETKSVEVRMYNTLFLSILLYGCEYGSVCLSVRKDAARRCWASGVEGITWLEDRLKIEFKEIKCERVCLLDWNISCTEGLKCFGNKITKFALRKIRVIASIAAR